MSCSDCEITFKITRLAIYDDPCYCPFCSNAIDDNADEYEEDDEDDRKEMGEWD